MLPKKCRSTEDDILVGGGQYHCSFVIKQEVKYAASCTNQYQTPTVKDADTDEQLVVERNYITADDLTNLFSFTVHMDVRDSGEGTSSSSKRLKIELSSEPSKNEIFCKTLREMVKVEGLVISTGYIDGDTPPTYSPYHRSNPDLYMYHEENFKRGVVACIANCNDEEDGDHDAGADAEKEAVRLTMVCSGAWEMKNATKATKQLYANMLHVGYQVIVKALKEGEVVDKMEVYGLAVNYERRLGWLYRLSTDFMSTKTIIKSFGTFCLADAINIIIEKLKGGQK